MSEAQEVQEVNAEEVQAENVETPADTADVEVDAEEGTDPAEGEEE